MSRKGFTIIELLAVIIIITLLMLITSTAITKILKDSKDDSYKNQIGLIKKAAEMWGSNNIYLLPEATEDSPKINNIPTVIEYIKLSNLYDSGMLEQTKNPKTNEYFNDNDLLIKITSTLKNGKNNISYEIITDSEQMTSIIDNYNYILYDTIGTPIYFNVATGESCTSLEYKASYSSSTNDYLNSKTGYNGILSETQTSNAQNSCLKFYVLDSDDEYMKLILDHNIGSATVYWISASDFHSLLGNESESVDARYGPVTLVNELYENTKNWVGTEPIDNYSYTLTSSNSSVDYTIKYRDREFKAKIPTVSEILKAVGMEYSITNTLNISFTNGYVRILPSIPECASTFCKYRWLYDRTSNYCKNYGCANNSIGVTYAYWTSDSIYNTKTAAWKVNTDNNIQRSGIVDKKCGIRPVIIVKKNKF